MEYTVCTRYSAKHVINSWNSHDNPEFGTIN